MSLFAEKNYVPNEFICWYDSILVPEIDMKLMNTSYIAKLNEGFEIDARFYETPGKYINNIKGTNYKLNVT
jgi:hypothetical protein